MKIVATMVEEGGHLAARMEYRGVEIKMVLDRRRKHGKQHPDPQPGVPWAFHPGRLINVSADGEVAVWSVFPAHRMHERSRGVDSKAVMRRMLTESMKHLSSSKATFRGPRRMDGFRRRMAMYAMA